MTYRFILIAVLLSSTTLFSQDNSKYTFGIKAGINSTDQWQPNGGGFTDFKMGLGFYTGVTAHKAISDKIGVAVEILLSNHKSIFELNTTTFDLTDFDPVIMAVVQKSDFSQLVLQLPILFQYTIVPRANVQAGPQLSYIVNSDIETFDFDDAILFPQDEPFGVDFALGWNLGLTDSLDLSGRYYFGLTKRDTIKPSVFQLGVAYQL